MSGLAIGRNRYAGKGVSKKQLDWRPDRWLLVAVVFLIGLGVLMVGSASISIADKQMGEPFYYFIRQLIYAGMSVFLALLVMRIDLGVWERNGVLLLAFGFALLVLVLIPGVGREVNGSMRWLPLGFANMQPSELVKLFVVVYISGYLVRHADEVRSAASGFMKPMLVLAVFAMMLLLEPDFGSATIMLATAVVLLFLGGVKIWQLGMLLALLVSAMGALAVMSPYRMQRITAYMDPWADPFDSGFQLTQALIAFGRGEWLGVGLGSSVQKLFYLPEAHTDFLFAVLGEELGFIGVMLVVCAFMLLVFRVFVIGRRAERGGQLFAAYLAYGLAVWIGMQAFINMAVNMGLLPTKGLTLPLMSYGGSSLVVMGLVLGLLFRIDYESSQYAVSNQRRSLT